MPKLTILLTGFLLCVMNCIAQVEPVDSLRNREELSMDTADLDDLDALLGDLDSFLDSLMRPRSYAQLNLSLSTGYYNYKRSGTVRVHTESATTYSPSLGYFDRSGLGIALTGFIINDSSKLNLYEFSLSPSFDYLRNRAFATGVSYTRYFAKDSLNFYVSPLQNEINGYFTYRRSWLRPSISLGYAWGTRKDLEERLSFIQSLRLRKRILNFLQSYKQVNDFSAMVSVVHDFYFLHVLSRKDNIRLTPQLIFTSGTQQYGFNQLSNTYTAGRPTRTNLLNTARQFSLDTKKEFKPLSLGFSLKTEYAIGKFYVQPQVLLDYYFPAEEDNFATVFSLNLGFYF